jgi:hypothetical protein
MQSQVFSESFVKSLPIASASLKVMAKISVKRGFFGNLMPTDPQIGWAYGFCDSYAQNIGVTEDEDFIFFIGAIFDSIFGKKGLT